MPWRTPMAASPPKWQAAWRRSKARSRRPTRDIRKPGQARGRVNETPLAGAGRTRPTASCTWMISPATRVYYSVSRRMELDGTRSSCRKGAAPDEPGRWTDGARRVVDGDVQDGERDTMIQAMRRTGSCPSASRPGGGDCSLGARQRDGLLPPVARASSSSPQKMSGCASWMCCLP